MKNLTYLLFIMLTSRSSFSNNYLVQEVDSKKDKEELYIKILESYISPSHEKYIEDYSSIGIDLSFDETLSEESEENILNYFREKYQMDVRSASLDKIVEEVEKGIRTTFDVLYLKINDVEFIDSSNVVSEGLYYFSTVAAEAYKTFLSKTNNEWKVDEKELLWIS